MLISGATTFTWKAKQWRRAVQPSPGVAKRLLVLTMCGKNLFITVGF